MQGCCELSLYLLLGVNKENCMSDEFSIFASANLYSIRTKYAVDHFGAMRGARVRHAKMRSINISVDTQNSRQKRFRSNFQFFICICILNISFANLPRHSNNDKLNHISNCIRLGKLTSTMVTYWMHIDDFIHFQHPNQPS